MRQADLDTWDANFAVSAKGTFLSFKYAAKQMVAQGRGGRLVGASSIAGKMGMHHAPHGRRVLINHTQGTPTRSRTVRPSLRCADWSNVQVSQGKGQSFFCLSFVNLLCRATRYLISNVMVDETCRTLFGPHCRRLLNSPRTWTSWHHSEFICARSYSDGDV